ncbi:hypothetical protein ACGFNU_27665 [Spirillospora sp. NPDC048911]|uniref:hypothetical protein n=1 Tax=Spirillospora sp. NPDC048911 TaxID=3364527 RepID=UPI003721E847
MIQKAKGRTGARGLVMLTAAPLLGVVVHAAGADQVAQADGPVRVAAERHAKPHAERQRERHAKLHGKRQDDRQHAHKHGKGHGSRGLVVDTSGPASAIVPGRTYNWPFTVTNTSAAKTGPAVFRASLPASLGFVSATRKCSFASGAAVCPLGALKPRRAVTGVITAKIGSQAKPRETITGTATVSWGRSRVSKPFPRVRVADTADVSMTKTAPPAIRPGEAIPYEIKVRNAGPSAATAVVVESPLPLDARRGRPGQGQHCGVGHNNGGTGNQNGVGAGNQNGSPRNQSTTPGIEGGSSSVQSGRAGCGAAPGSGQGEVRSGRGPRCGSGPDGRPSSEGGARGGHACGSQGGASGEVRGRVPVEIISGDSGCRRRGMSYVCGIGALAAGQEKTLRVKLRMVKQAKPGTALIWPSKAITSTIELNLGNNSASTRTEVREPGAFKPGAPQAPRKLANEPRKLANELHKAGNAPRKGGNDEHRGVPGDREGLPVHGGPNGLPDGGTATGGNGDGGGAPAKGVRALPRTGIRSAIVFDAALCLTGAGLILAGLGRRPRRRQNADQREDA